MSFEKDDDDNHHIAFVTSTANLRAYNYTLLTPPRRCSEAVCKEVAGRIVPALSATTSAVCGLVILQLWTLQRRAVEQEEEQMAGT